jgi:hypothetical protein
LALGAAAGGGQNQMLVGPKKTKTRCEKFSRRVKKRFSPLNSPLQGSPLLLS